VIKTINGGNYVNIFARNLDTTWIYVKSNGDDGWLSIGVIVSNTPFASLPTTVPTGIPTSTAVATDETTCCTTTSGTTCCTTQTPPTSGSVTGTGSITVKVLPLTSGELIPTLNVYALNVATGAWVANQFFDSCAAGFTCIGEYPGYWYMTLPNVPAGDYAVFAYRWMNDEGFWGAFTKNPSCNGSGTNEDHSFVLVHVTNGAKVSGPSLCDRWGVNDGVVPPEPH